MVEFEQVRKLYPGVKRGLETELKQFQKHKDWKAVLPLLLPALEAQIKTRQELTNKGKWIPAWPHFRTWIVQRRWEETAQLKPNKLEEIDYCQFSIFE